MVHIFSVFGILSWVMSLNKNDAVGQERLSGSFDALN